jgi:hypothetical protein
LLAFWDNSDYCEHNNQLVHIVNHLKGHLDSKVSWPSDEEMRQYASLVNEREPLVSNVIGFIDGLSLPVKCSDDMYLQNGAYNGYHHDTMCNNVFAFSITGLIICACINYPGSFHDSVVANDLIDVTIRKTGGYAFCVDSGFPRSNELYDKFVGSIS